MYFFRKFTSDKDDNQATFKESKLDEIIEDNKENILNYEIESNQSFHSQLTENENPKLINKKEPTFNLESFFQTKTEISNSFEGSSDQSISSSNSYKKRKTKKNQMSKTARLKKNCSQIEILKAHFNELQAWDKQTITFLSKLTNLRHTQVYKWYWDQKLKKKKIENNKLAQSNDPSQSILSKFEKEEYWVLTKYELSENHMNNAQILDFLMFFIC